MSFYNGFWSLFIYSFDNSMWGMEVIAPLAELLISFAVIGSLTLMAMIFGLLLAQLMYGLFEG